MSDRITAGVIAGYVHEVSDRHQEDEAAAHEADAKESVADVDEEDASE